MTSTQDLPAAQPHATAEQVEAARHDSKLAQVLYHDWEAEGYDDKWSISYDQRCVDYARGRFDAIVPPDEQRNLPYERALELGCGTGFFLLNLIQSGVSRRGSVTDLSPGMVRVAVRNAESLGLDIDGRVADAEGIPFDDDTFDLVVGHAVLHHIPDVELSLREVVRVLRPGGRFVFAGEPTIVGNAYARTLADLTWNATVRAMKLPGLASWRRPQEELDENSRAAALEWIVDLHTFDPADLEQMATNAGAVDVRTATRGVHRGDAGLAGAHLRVDCSAGQARLGVGEVRVRQLDHAELGRRQRVAARRAQGVVLQRDGDRGQTVVAFTLADVAYLGSAGGAQTLREVASFDLTGATSIADIDAVRARFGARTPVLVETVLLRRRAVGKLGDVGDWLLTGEALQQATAAAVAQHRAHRLTGRVVHDVTCSIGTELAALAGHASYVLGSDVDPVRLAMARHNVPGVPLCRADALRPITRGTVVVADPARRRDGRRRFDPRDYTPPLDALLDTYRGRDFVVKLSPGIDFDRLPADGEVEVTSLAGEVREACLWTGGLVGAGSFAARQRAQR